MIKLDNYKVVGWAPAIRGMRNPMNSYPKSDSDICEYGDEIIGHIGPNDLHLMMQLRKAGTDHRKFMRMLVVYVDITAPLYWWKEFDTYKVGTVANSCSTMHRIHSKTFVLDDFSFENVTGEEAHLQSTIDILNKYREYYVKDRNINDWWNMIQLLPSSYNQKRTVMLNYEVLTNIYESRKKHKLDEWKEFCKWIEILPYSKIIIGGEIDGA